MPTTRALIRDLQAELDARASPDTRSWWERYLKGAIAFRGVPMAKIRAATLHVAPGLDTGDASATARLRSLAYALLREPMAEDKLAGILLLQEHLLARGALDGMRDLAALAELFDEGHIADWNTCDWLCVRVIGPLVERDGRRPLRRLASWRRATGLWRRRAGAVGLVPLVGRGDAVMPGLVDTALLVCAANVRDPERFSQTAVGWLLRELSEAEPARVFHFVREHRTFMSTEAVRMASARLSDSRRRRLGVTGRRSRR